MPKIAPLSSTKIIKILEKVGFKVALQKGSHVIMMNDRRIRIVMSVYPRKALKPGLVRAIIREAGVSREKFLEFLEEK